MHVSQKDSQFIKLLVYNLPVPYTKDEDLHIIQYIDRLAYFDPARINFAPGGLGKKEEDFGKSKWKIASYFVQ